MAGGQIERDATPETETSKSEDIAAETVPAMAKHICGALG
jgi:hypothetical protein